MRFITLWCSCQTSMNRSFRQHGSGRSYQNRRRYADDKVNQRFFQQSGERNSKINDPTWPGLKFFLRLYPCPPNLQVSRRLD